MKVLLVGEMSSLHKYLKEGLLLDEENEVCLLADSGGWKEINGIDIPYPIATNGGLQAKIKQYIDIVHTIRGLKQFDVVQLVNIRPFALPVNGLCVNILKRNNKKICLVSAGTDYPLVKAYLDKKLDYYIYDMYTEALHSYSKKTLKGILRILNDKYVISKVDRIIPSLYEYWVGYAGNRLLNNVIPFPINIDRIQYEDNKVGNKVCFFHGLNNEKTKGTPYIRDAMERLQRDFPDEVDICIDGKMPFDKYVNLMKRTNVVIDQCLSYGYGINACIAMAQGKVVLSSVRKETLDAFHISNCPVFSFEPNPDSIYESLCYILKNKDRISDWGKQSRAYVEELHNYRIIASKYVNVWKSL